ncbi:T9SS type A sorting domain-containing protein [candidate division KSB1 bacterium]|nr:T9SS type A sorting domain-containing protein [candidate division KSB1 bacterium]
MFAYYIKSGKTLVLTILLAGLLFSGISNAQVSKNVWMYIYNSDGSVPSSGDLSVRAYLKKNPADYIESVNVKNSWNYDINTQWGFYPNRDDVTDTTASIGDEIVIEIENISGGIYHGERSVIKGTLDGIMWQQLGQEGIPLMGEMVQFTANVNNGTVELLWALEKTSFNLGFNIFRREESDWEFVKINKTTIFHPSSAGKDFIHTFQDNSVEFGNTYIYKIQAVDWNGGHEFSKPLTVYVDSHHIPERYELSQNFPNPFNPETTINYQLPKDRHVKLVIYNALGRVVRELVNEEKGAGSYSITWNGLSDSGIPVSSGIYFYKIEAGIFTQVKKMTFSK